MARLTDAGARSLSDLVSLDSLARPGECGFIEPRLHVTLLASGDGLGLRRVACCCQPSGFEQREVTPQPLLVIVHRGAFIRRTHSGRALADTGFGYFAAPDQEEEFAHPEAGGDRCTSLTVAPNLLSAITGGEQHLPSRPVEIDSSAYRRFRSLLAEVRTHERDDWLERALNLFGDLLMRARPSQLAVRRPHTAVSHRAMINDVREALVARPVLSVPELARIASYSPYYLSRVFRQETGTSISTYRLRLRTRAAIARIEDGESNLARLASELGFADHSHMTRLIARESGSTPTAMRQRHLALN